MPGKNVVAVFFLQNGPVIGFLHVIKCLFQKKTKCHYSGQAVVNVKYGVVSQNLFLCKFKQHFGKKCQDNGQRTAKNNCNFIKNAFRNCHFLRNTRHQGEIVNPDGLVPRGGYHSQR